MKIITICIYTTVCFLMVGCKKSTSTIREYDTVENYATELEKLCLKCHDDSVTFSLKTKEEGYITECDFKYLGSLKIKRDNFKVIQRTILSGQLPKALRANVSIKLFLKGKLYGEYTGFDKLHKIKVVSNTLCLYDSRTKTKAFFKLKDSIPNNLYFPHEETDSGLIGEMFYFNKYQNR